MIWHDHNIPNLGPEILSQKLTCHSWLSIPGNFKIIQASILFNMVYSIGDVNEYPTMHYFGNHSQSASDNDSTYNFDWVFQEISVKKLHCGNVDNMPYCNWIQMQQQYVIWLTFELICLLFHIILNHSPELRAYSHTKITCGHLCRLQQTVSTRKWHIIEWPPTVNTQE